MPKDLVLALTMRGERCRISDFVEDSHTPQSVIQQHTDVPNKHTNIQERSQSSSMFLKTQNSQSLMS